MVCFYPVSLSFRLQANSVFLCRLLAQKLLCTCDDLCCSFGVERFQTIPEWSKTHPASHQRCSSVVDYQADVLFASVVSIDLT